MRPSLPLIIYMLCTGYLSAQSILIKQSVPLQITWAKNLPDSFAFSESWSYPNNVELKSDGRAGYFNTGFYPELDQMLDSNGIVIADSAIAFYQTLDTSHQYHSLKSETDCYEWAGSDYIIAQEVSSDSVYCYSLCNAASHCSLEMLLVDNKCYVQISLLSIKGNNGEIYFPCTGGTITIDKNLWKSGKMKAMFDLRFKPDNDGRPTYWRGKILAQISKQGD
ncbi:MAG TPA: hypothetical protein VK174_05205 [Chitinophagales bacterium]|nr:hypothetical protein [Chitinophagales bacterium]